jgi:hypothetical protein
MKQISEVEENRSRHLKISVQKPAVVRGGEGWGGVTPPHNRPFFHLIRGYFTARSRHRVLGFFSSRPNRDPPPPTLTRRRVCPPPPFGSGGDTFACGRGGGSQFGRGERHCGTLGINVLCVLLNSIYRRRIRYSPPRISFMGHQSSTPSYMKLQVGTKLNQSNPTDASRSPPRNLCHVTILFPLP